MNGPLAALAERNLSTAPLAVQPRLQSRFESGLVDAEQELLSEPFRQPAVESDRSQDTAVAAPSIISNPALSDPGTNRSEATPGAPIENDALLLPPSVPETVEYDQPDHSRPPEFGLADSSLRRRVDLLDQRLSSLSARDELPLSDNVDGQAIDAATPSIETTQHTHHHHERRVQQLQRTEIDQSQTIVNDNTTIEKNVRMESILPDALVEDVRQTDRKPIATPTVLPNATPPEPMRVAETRADEASPTRASATFSLAEPQRESPAADVPPVIVEKPSAPSTEISSPETRLADTMASPRVIVEAEDSHPRQGNHTVNVSIGRIEIRSSKTQSTPAASTAPRIKPSARIMNLDDYVRSRREGAG